MPNFTHQRNLMVKDQLKNRDITNQAVLSAMNEVPREKFVPEEMIESAYQDSPLPIGHDQTISQPYVVAKMCQLLELIPEDKVLDIGAGSGYQTAILSRIVKQVFAIEIIDSLAKKARKKLAELEYSNVTIISGDGRAGYPPESPYDAIKSAAAAKKVPEAWKNQLKIGGRLVLPLGGRLSQKITKYKKHPGGFSKKQFSLVRFVPLT